MDASTGTRRIPAWILVGVFILTILNLCTAGIAFAPTHLQIVRGGTVFDESVTSSGTTGIVLGLLHILAALLLVGGMVVLRRERSRKARGILVASAVCALAPSPLFGLVCLLFITLVVRTTA
jgi:hypothetical protein